MKDKINKPKPKRQQRLAPKPKPQEYLALDDVELISLKAKCLRDEILVRVLFFGACRLSEALSLAVDDIDFATATIKIEHLKARLNLQCPECRHRIGRGHIYCPGCGVKVEGTLAEKQERRRVRSIPLDMKTLDLLASFIEQGGPVLIDGKRLIFGIRPTQAYNIIRECAARAGFRELVNPETGQLHYVSPHRLRDAFATMVVQKDDSTDSIRLLQEHLGHSNIGTTMRYRKIAGRELRDWYQRAVEK